MPNKKHEKVLDTSVNWHVKAWYGHVDQKGFLNGLGVYWEPDGGCKSLPKDYVYPDEVKEETTTQDVITITVATTTSSTRVKERVNQEIITKFANHMIYSLCRLLNQLNKRNEYFTTKQPRTPLKQLYRLLQTQLQLQ